MKERCGSIVRREVSGFLGGLCAIAFLAAVLPVGESYAAGPAAKTKEATKPAAVKAAASSSTSSAAAPADKKATGGLAKVLGDDSSGKDKPPVYIRSNTVHLDAKQRIFTYRGDVEAKRMDVTITSDVMTGKYDENNEIRTIIAQENVVITRADYLKASSNRADYDVKTGVIVLTEGPELNDRGNVLDADKVTIFLNEDRSEAEGHVRVKVTRSQAGSVVGVMTEAKKPAAPAGVPAGAAAGSSSSVMPGAAAGSESNSSKSGGAQ